MTGIPEFRTTTVDVAHPRNGTGDAPPEIRTRIPGPESQSWLLRFERVAAPMGPKRVELELPDGRCRVAPPGGVVFSRGYGSNVWDPDDNRFVDLAAGFGSMLLGHNHAYVRRAIELQSDRLLQAMGDLYPADAKIGLLQQLARLFPVEHAQVILGQSGADAVTAALKTAALYTGRPGVVAMSGAYHGLSYAPLSACGLRESYRAPFQTQLNPHVHFVPYPRGDAPDLASLRQLLVSGTIGAVLLEPILGRGGVHAISKPALQEIRELCSRHGCLLIADEIWTGLGRCGSWLHSTQLEIIPDLVCLGKGLGGGLPISACVGRADVMASWSRAEEVVHTSTFAGAPLACATALACLDVLRRHGLIERSAQLGAHWKTALEGSLKDLPVEVRGRGLMLAVDLGPKPGAAGKLMAKLLSAGYITSTGGGAREVLVLTPPLTIASELLTGFVPVLRRALEEL
ncbi:MAG: 4-aminobutyrate aminotransferase [Pseudomonadota bacterium]|jgi:4-aminobutyrate aminotransferase/(S)-3-amino-2-methylpropionate transaminase